MHFLTLLATIVATSASISAVAPVTVGYTLDLNPPRSLSSLSCGAFFTQNYPQYHALGDLPTFYGEVPGAYSASPEAVCGSCWQLTYNPNQAPVYVVAVDDANGIQLSKPAFDAFAGVDAYKGSIDATAVEVPSFFCGLGS